MYFPRLVPNFVTVCLRSLSLANYSISSFTKSQLKSKLCSRLPVTLKPDSLGCHEAPDAPKLVGRGHINDLWDTTRRRKKVSGGWQVVVRCWGAEGQPRIGWDHYGADRWELRVIQVSQKKATWRRNKDQTRSNRNRMAGLEAESVAWGKFERKTTELRGDQRHLRTAGFQKDPKN